MRIAAIIALAVMATASDAQIPKEHEATAAAMAAYSRGEYLTATDALKKAAFPPDGKASDEFAFQMWEQVAPTITNELDPAMVERGAPGLPPDPSWAARATKATPRGAVAEIVARARSTRLVILNEAHDSPRDRAFALQIARALRALGYSVLAAEAFAHDPDDRPGGTAIQRLQRDGFARLSTGFYVRDPVYAGFVREALALGYEPAAYEQTAKQRPAGGGIAAREQAEAENLMALLVSHPTAKFLIYVGYSHVAEAPIAGKAGKDEWMAARLKRMSGIDPLTIDQASVAELSPSGRAVQSAAAPRMGDRPAVLFEGDRPLVLGPDAGAVDLQVVHPPRTYRFGRPAWLAMLGGRPIAVPVNLLPTTGRRLIQAFAAAAPADAVPLDQVVVQAGVTAPMLMVPLGPVRFATQP